MRGDRNRLLDILEAIEKISSRLTPGKDAFLEDEMIQVWIIHYFQVIGEAAARVSEDFRGEHPEIPWADIISMRNALVHHYFGIDLDQIWDTVITDLPPLKQAIEKLLNDLPG